MLEIPRLTLSSAPPSAMLLPQGAPTAGIVHLGLGNFHRAHFAIYTAKAVRSEPGDWGIVGFSFRNPTISGAMNEQDNLYAVIDISPTSNEALIPAIHTEVFAGLDKSQRIIELIADPKIKIVSLTITESGYQISQATNGLNFSHPDVVSDVSLDNSPKTAIGLIVRGLLRRLKESGGPITILSCDNLSHNGDVTKRLIQDFISQLPVEKARLLEPYLESSVTFPNSMVDRIVPGTTDLHVEMVEKVLGIRDEVPVAAEPFAMWVLEDNFAGGRPKWESAGAIFTNEVSEYETLKLRLLNGTHSLLAYLGALAGKETIPESRFHESIAAAARKLIFNEYLPTLDLPHGLDVLHYIDQLFSRWSNTVLGDKTSRVGSDGSTKLPQRITEPVLFHCRNGEPPKLIALTVASYLACIAPLHDFAPGIYADQMKDSARESLQSLARSSHSTADFVAQVFTQSGIFGPELGELDMFIALVTKYLEEISLEGIENAIELALQD